MGVHGSRLYFSLHALRNIFLILPVVVIMEVILAQSMMTAGPPYPLHMSYFCSSCGITQSTSLISIIRSGDNFVPTCLTDHIMEVMAGTSLEFKNAFLNSMVGHALMILSFQLDRHGSIEGPSDGGEAGGDTGSLPGAAAELDPEGRGGEGARPGGQATATNMHNWHLLGYFILLVDSVLELVFMRNIPMKDPAFMMKAAAENAARGTKPYGCDGTVVAEITEEADLLHSMGVKVTVLRCITASLVILCYHKSQKTTYGRSASSASVSDASEFELTPAGLKSA